MTKKHSTKTERKSTTPTVAIAIALLVAFGAVAVVPALASAGDTASVAGDVTDTDTGEGLGNATVEVINDSGVVATVTTADNGSYRVTNLTPGDYTIRVSAAGYDTRNRSVSVGSSGTTANIRLGRTPTYTLTLPADGSSYAVALPGPVEQKQVGDLFNREFDGVIYAYDSDSNPSRWEQVRFNDDIATFDALVIVPDQQESEVTVTLSFNGTAGDPQPDKSTDELDNGLHFVAVPNSDPEAAFADAENITEVVNPSTLAEPQTTDVKNESTFSNYTLGASGDAPRLNPFKGYFVRVNATETIQTDVVEGITRPAATDVLDLGNGTVTGTVVNSTGAPVEGATVTFANASVSATTDPNGDYTVRDVPAGARAVTIEADGFVPVEERVVVGVNETVTVDATLTGPATIQGTVTDAETGDGIGGATIRAENESNSEVEETTTAADGSYSFTSLRDDRTYQVTIVDAPDHVAGASTTVTEAELNATGVDFALAPKNATLAGTVTDATSGDGVANATVAVTNTSSGAVVARPTTDADGNYRVSVGAHESYNVSADAADYAAADGPTVSVGANETATGVNVALEPLNGTVAGNVTDAKTGEALSGVTVTVTNQSDATVGRGTTDANGSYTVEVPGSETHTVSVDPTDHDPASVNVSVGANETVTGVDLAPEPKNGTISGTVTDNVTGDVVSGAAVRITSLNSSFAETVETASDGSYGVEVPPHESYNVSADAGNYTAAVNRTVSVDAGGSATEDIALEPLNGSISGTVTDANDGSLVAGATVNVTNAGTGEVVEQVTTDGTASYSVEVAPHETYDVTVEDPDYESGSATVSIDPNESVTQDFTLEPLNGTVAGNVTDAKTGEALSGVTVTVTNQSGSVVNQTKTAGDGSYTVGVPGSETHTVSVDPADYDPASTTLTVNENEDITGVDLAPEPKNATVAGNVTDAKTGEGIAATVTVDSVNSSFNETVQAASDGSYSVEVPPHENFTVEATEDDYQAADVNVSVGPNEDATVDLALSPMSGNITGTVLDNATDNPIVDGNVTVESLNTSFTDTVTTDANGDYTVEVPGSETFRVTANETDYRANTTTVEVGAGENVTQNFTLSRVGTLSGTVIDAETAESIENATVSVIDDGTTVTTTTTDSSGDYSTEPILTGTYDIRFEAQGYTDKTETKAISQGDNELNVQLAALGSIEGNVTDAETGEAIENGTVTAVSGNDTFTTTTDENGSYALFDLPTQRDYNVTADGVNHSATNTTVSLSAGENATQDFALSALNGTIEGTITDNATGEAIEGVTVQVEETGTNGCEDAIGGGTMPGVCGEDTTGANGTYSIDVDANTDYNVTVTAPDHDDESLTAVGVGPNETVTRNFQLVPQNSTVSGAVLNNKTGDTIAGANVTVDSKNSSFSGTVTTNGSGGYSVEVPPHETFQVTANETDHVANSTTTSVGAGSGGSSTADLRLPPKDGTVSGFVINQDTGEPIATNPENATVIITNDSFDTRVETSTNLSGGYSTTVPGSETYTVNATHPDYGAAIPSTDNQVGPNESTTVNVTIQPLNGTIEGTITDNVTGEAIEGVTVQAEESGTDACDGGLTSSGFCNDDTTGANGTYSIEVDPNTEYNITVTAADHDDESITFVPVDPNETVTQNFQLDPQNSTVSGTVLNNKTGGSIASVDVTVESQDSSFSETVTTDGSGAYSVEVPPHETFTVKSSPADYDANSTVTSVGAGSGGSSTADLRLQPKNGSISGFVINGDTGEPIEVAPSQATVTAVGNQTTVEGPAFSDASYTLDVPGSESYTVGAEHPDYDTTTSTFTDVTVGANESVESINLTVQPLNGTIEGTVTDSVTGEAIESATVQVEEAGTNACDLTGSGFCDTTSTSANGDYSVEVPYNNEYNVTVSVSTHDGATATQLPGAAGETVASNETVTQDFALDPLKGDISGNVTDATTGDAISGATVTVVNTSTGTTVATLSTDANGDYSVELEPHDTYDVTADAADYVASDTVSIPLDANESVTQDFPLDPKNGTINGTVTNSSDGTGIDGATVTVESLNTSFTDTVTTDANGDYTVEVPGNETIRVRANATDFFANETNRDVAPNESLTQNLSLDRRAFVTGRVFNETNTEPIENATVEVISNETGNVVDTTTTDSEGRYTTDDVPVGGYTLRYSADGYDTKEKGVELVAGENQENALLQPSDGGTI